MAKNVITMLPDANIFRTLAKLTWLCVHAMMLHAMIHRSDLSNNNLTLLQPGLFNKTTALQKLFVLC